MSEEAKITYLQEKINETETSRKVYSFLTTVASGFFGFFIMDLFLPDPFPSKNFSAFIAAISLLGAIVSGALEIHYSRQKKFLDETAQGNGNRHSPLREMPKMW